AAGTVLLSPAFRDLKITQATTFSWSGGTIKGEGNNTVEVTVTGGNNGNISGGADKTLDNIMATDLKGQVTWTGAGNIIIKRGTMSVKTGASFLAKSSGAIQDLSNLEGSTIVVVEAGATFNSDPPAGRSTNVSVGLNNYGTVTVN